MPKELFTVGYEGLDIPTFIARLKAKRIDCLLDVRQLPLSRKPGFSKASLSRRLSRHKIRYVHFKDLGSPKDVRHKLRVDNDYTTFFRRMERHLSKKKNALENALDYVTHNTCCLMCFERLATMCHRKIVAKKIKYQGGNGLKITDI
jgi:uncharacterized protein (DUF488 family)